MADVTVLPSRGVPCRGLVDSNGIASNGSSTVIQLAARGIKAACAVDATGVSVGGLSVAQLASAGIRAFCPVDENGNALDASTAIALRARGIRPVVLLDANGIALNGSSGIATLAARGLEYFCPVDEAGNATTMGAVLLLSNSTVLDNATIGTTVGALSVVSGSGTYTYSFLSNPGTLFAIAGSNLNTAAALTAGIKTIQVRASGGVPTPVDRTFNITVAPAPVAPVNTVLPVISGATVVGQTLSTTDGTWTGFPAPSYTYQWNRAPTAQVSQFLARTSGLDSTHINAYTALINGLVADGIWSKLDVLQIYATQDSTTAKLNLVSASNTAALSGTPPTFTADRGYTGTMGSGVYVNTAWGPITPPGALFTQNSAHISAWCVTHVANTGSNGAVMGQVKAGQQTSLFVRDAAGNTSYRANDNGLSAGVADADGLGHYMATRINSTTMQGYKNGSQVQNISSTSAAPFDNAYTVCCIDDFSSGPSLGSGSQMACASIGSGLSSTDATNFYNRLRTYMTAVGVP